MFSPLTACGRIFLLRENEPPAYTGTGAVYLKSNVVVTAAHCVPDVSDATFLFQSPFGNVDPWTAQRVERHPDIDVAVLVGTSGADEQLPSYSTIDSKIYVDGTDFVAYGYPAEGDTSVGRHFKGHIQRQFRFDPPGGGPGYLAMELSIPAPAGLSGGPVSIAHTPDAIYAVVTTNHDSSLVIDSYEEEQRNGVINRGKITRVVSYGIAAVLTGATELWINDIAASAG